MRLQAPSTPTFSLGSAGYMTLLGSWLLAVFSVNSAQSALNQVQPPPSTIIHQVAPSPEDLKDKSMNTRVRLGSNGIPQMIGPEDTACASGLCPRECSKRPTGTSYSDYESDHSRRMFLHLKSPRREIHLFKRFGTKTDRPKPSRRTN